LDAGTQRSRPSKKRNSASMPHARLSRASLPGAPPRPPQSIGKSSWRFRVFPVGSLAVLCGPADAPAIAAGLVVQAAFLRLSSSVLRTCHAWSASMACALRAPRAAGPKRGPSAPAIAAAGLNWETAWSFAPTRAHNGPTRCAAASMASATGCHPWHPAASFGGRPCPPAFGLSLLSFVGNAGRAWWGYAFGSHAVPC